jgi:acetyl-CoA C-acetyltransferase
MISLIEAYKSIKLGENECVLAGGVESMSNTPYLQNKLRKGNKFGNINLIDSMIYDGLTDPFSNKHMGELTENLCEKYNISKEEQDNYAKLSYEKARKAILDNSFKNEITNITIKNRKGDILINEDEEINKISDLKKLDTLKSVFKKNGTITAGNASKLSDGACFFILASESFIKKYNISYEAEILDYNLLSGSPNDFPLLPINSVTNLCNKNNLNINDIDYFEVNEAFAIAPIMFSKKLNISYNKINIYGGAISMGHPIGCSGARIVSTLISVLKNSNKKLGCATICNGGGGATSLIIKNKYI